MKTTKGFPNYMYVSVVLLLLWSLCLGYECPKENTICETSLDIRNHMTMIYKQGAYVFAENSKLYRFDVTDTSQADHISPDEVITADGWEKQRILVVANKTLPGPPIIVYEGQTVVVHVRNHLLSETVTIHWHGLPLKGNPFMDGVAYVTQCPILPGQTFTYRFKATPKGTYWYHSHIGFQRSNGLYGALIIRESQTNDIEDRILQIQEWNHDWDSNRDYLNQLYGLIENRQYFAVPKSLDDQYMTLFKLHSVLINGKGRIYNITSGDHNGAPLEVIHVQKDKEYRLRVINTGADNAFRFSVDDHPLKVVASDGHDVQSVDVESFVISGGERYDVIIKTNMSVGNYWIRAGSLETGKDMHLGQAILKYSGATEDEPITAKRKCSASSKCEVLNCMFPYYPTTDYTECIHVDQLRSLSGSAPSADGGNFKEFFFNFGWPGTTYWPASINGRQFLVPEVSALTQPLEFETSCNDRDCGEQKVCTCTYSVNYQHGDIVQIVLVNMGKGFGGAHPIHIHGHSFYVLKVGFGVYNQSTGVFKGMSGQNTDINCRGGVPKHQSFCNDATWSDPSWQNGNVPGAVIHNSPLKDTISVPAGGYVVIRIKADNPGLWLLHCHMETHAAMGMTMILNESFSQVPKTPAGFPACRSYPANFQRTGNAGDNQENLQQSTQTDSGFIDTTSFTVVVAIMACLICILLVMVVVQFIRNSGKSNKNRNLNSKTNEGYQ